MRDTVRKEECSEFDRLYDVREVYRVLLKRAAKCGYPRQKDETPYEYQRRLCDNTPLADPELLTITDAYTSTRYGGKVPAEEEVSAVKDAWAIVEGKWR